MTQHDAAGHNDAFAKLRDISRFQTVRDPGWVPPHSNIFEVTPQSRAYCFTILTKVSITVGSWSGDAAEDPQFLRHQDNAVSDSGDSLLCEARLHAASAGTAK